MINKVKRLKKFVELKQRKGKVLSKETYKADIQYSPNQVIYILPHANTCQVVQFFPNTSQPESRFCSIALDKTQDIPSLLHVQYGKRGTTMSNCPFNTHCIR